jgi:hypothetical protein
MVSSYTKNTLEDSSVQFTVTPGDIKNTIGGIALASIIGFFFAFSGGPNGASWFQILFGIAIGYGAHRGILWWRTRRANPGGAPRGGSFRVTPNAIITSLGETVPRSEVQDIIESNASQDNDTSYMLGATTAKNAYLLATGMDVGTALKLRREVCDMLGLDQEPATAGS